MSRAFVNEERFEQAGGEELVDRPISEFANYVTPTGALALQDQEAALMAELAPLKKSAEDAFNKDKVAELERDLRYLRARLDSAVLVDPAGQDHTTVLFGASVTVQDDAGQAHCFHIVGEDEADAAINKVKLATILGTFQSTLINFKYLSKKWQENCGEERLLGVSLTGIMDNEYTNGHAAKATGLFNVADMLEGLREEAVKTNKLWAAKLNIPVSAAITCVKPSGTVSQLVDSASGIHARHSPYYIRTVRADKKDPLAVMMKDMGFPVEDDVTKPEHTYVFSFPQKSPEHAVFRKDMSAIEQLELWLTYQRHWCEHKPSVTISVKEEEWPAVGAWVYDHFDEMSGVSFLPFSDHVYRQAPYQDCTKEEYEALLAKMPKNVNWADLAKYEKRDSTTGSQELACVAGGCEI